MKDIAVFRLNELFKRWAADEKLIRSELMMTFTTATGSKVTVHPSSPSEAARYLRRFIKGDDVDFSPGDVRCDTATQSYSRPGSIIFKGFGYVRDAANMVHYKTMLHLKFTGRPKAPGDIGEMESHGSLSFHDHFGDDIEEPNDCYEGPTVHEFISELSRAGHAWANIEFKTAHMRRNSGHTPLQLIK